jgi:arabinan endo-1,5-alpha-L-arabinosidase
MLILSLLPILTSCGQSLKAPSQLQGDFRVHDPSMIKQGDTYYVISTGDEHYYQGNIQIRSSTDLVSWKLVGVVFEAKPDWITAELGSTPPNLWAPDIAHFNGKYYLYYAGSSFGTNNSVIGLATNATLDPNSPDYKWVDQGMVTRSLPSFDWNAIDPNLTFDAGGAPWLALGSFWTGIKMQRLDPSTGKVSSTDTKLYALASRGGGPIEAPAIVYREGYYYLFVSFDFCCRGANSTYKIMVGRSTSITGPYADRSGKRMDQGGGTLVLESKGRYHCPGGQAVYLDSGTYRLVHHYYDALANGMPKLQIHDLAWTDDGWPIVT